MALAMSERKRVLWAENDEADYIQFKGLLVESLQAQGIEVDVRWVKSGDAATFALAADRGANLKVDLCILDLELSKDESTPDGIATARVVAKDNPGLPVVVLSSHLDRVGFSFPVRDLQDRREIIGYFDKAKIEFFIDAVTALLSTKPTVMLQLSDLHLGPPGSAQRLSRVLKELARKVQKESVNLLLVSGDFTDKGVQLGFRESLTVVRQFASDLSIGPDQVLTVPGNHDIERTGVDRLASFDRYLRFLEELYPADQESMRGAYRGIYDEANRSLGSYRGVEPEKIWYVRTIEAQRITIIGFNSVVAVPSTATTMNDGEISIEQLQDVQEALDELPLRARGYTKIALIHHNLMVVPRSANLEYQEPVIRNQGLFLKWLSEQGIRTVFHGHTHYASVCSIDVHPYPPFTESGWINKPIHVISSGTVGAEYQGPHQPLYSANLVKIESVGFHGDRVCSVRHYALDQNAISWRASNELKLIL